MENENVDNQLGDQEGFDANEINRLKEIILSGDSNDNKEIESLFEELKNETVEQSIDGTLDKNREIDEKNGIASMKQALKELQKEGVNGTIAVNIDQLNDRVNDYEKSLDNLEKFKNLSFREQKKNIDATPYGEEREKLITIASSQAKGEEAKAVETIVKEGVDDGRIPTWLADRADIV